jgi:ATP-binding cassette subfamily F protein 3
LAEFIGTSKSYDTVHVFQDLNLIVERGQKIGLVGPNGAGKSTLLKMLAQVETLTKGQLNWGSEVNSAYFAQHQFESLPLHKTIYELISHENPKWTINEVRTYLGSFLFSGDTIEKQLKVLSGGEISRLALAKMLATPSHLILLDEPTNHLDVQARDVVQEAISSFTGSMVCISHDRHFLNSVTNTIIEVNGGGITIYPGNYDYYLWRKQQEKQDTPTIQPEQAPIENRAAGNNYAERKKLSNRLKKLPVLILQCEDDIADQDKILNDGSLASEYEKIQAALDKKAGLEEDYLKLLEEQEVLKSKFE